MCEFRSNRQLSMCMFYTCVKAAVQYRKNHDSSSVATQKCSLELHKVPVKSQEFSGEIQELLQRESSLCLCFLNGVQSTFTSVSLT